MILFAALIYHAVNSLIGWIVIPLPPTRLTITNYHDADDDDNID